MSNMFIFFISLIIANVCVSAYLAYNLAKQRGKVSRAEMREELKEKSLEC